MGLAIIDTYDTIEEAERNIEKISKKIGFKKNDLTILKKEDGNYSICID